MFGNVGYRNFPTAFSPAALFAASEPGVWFDPSDVANTLWVRNLLTFTEQFDNAIWTKNNFLAFGSGSVANTTATTDPLGGNTADLLVTAAATAATRVYQGINSNIGQVNTTTWYVKKQTGSAVRWLRLTADQTGAGVNTYFDLDNGVFGTVGAGITPFVVSLPNGWYRVGITYAAVATDTSDQQFVNLANGNNMSTSYVGDGTSGFYIWGAQTEISSTPTEYQSITTVDAGTLARFPFATLYQDSAGTTPVTAPNQPVGLMLSKDKGLVLGPQLVINGDFSSGTTNWPITGGIGTTSVSSGQFTLSSTSTAFVAQSFVTVVGRTYQYSVTIISQNNVSFNAIRKADDNIASSNTVTLRAGLTDGAGTSTGVFVATATNTFIVIQANTGASITVDNISVKELPGNHATQSTAGSRPTYGIVPATGRRNLLTFSEQFDNAAWGKGTNTTVTANAFASPTGSTTADQITGTSAITLGADVGSKIFYQSLSNPTTNTASSVAGSVYLYSPSGGTYQIALFQWGGANVYQTVALAANVWTRVTISTAFGVTTGNAGLAIYSGNSTIYAWGAQLELGSTATAYQQVVTAFEVTEANVASLSYISFDGIDDFMITPTITPGTDKVQVFAGVRKLSDAAFAMFLELSTGAGNGRFGLSAPSAAATANYQFTTLGTSATFPTATGFAAPTTNVITAFSDINAPNAIVRVNGTLRGQSVGTQGTGNYLAYPLYIGRRGGISTPFNGQMYGLITRFGSNLTTTTISRTESWMSQETGVGV